MDIQSCTNYVAKELACGGLEGLSNFAKVFLDVGLLDEIYMSCWTDEGLVGADGAFIRNPIEFQRLLKKMIASPYTQSLPLLRG